MRGVFIPVWFVCRNLHQRIEEHKLREQRDVEPEDITQCFRILRKCQDKFDCLSFEMFFYHSSETNAKQTVRLNSRQTIFLEQFLLRLFSFFSIV